MEILHQLGDLFAQAVPVVVLILLFYVFLRANLFAPLQKVMAERDARTAGARKAADEAQAAARDKVKAYQDALKKARAEVYAEQDVLRKTVLEERSTVTKNARVRANEQVSAAKKQIAVEMAAARAHLEKASESLGGEIADSILKGAR
jgi:F-type H+-transporting ATPase subunit b